ncbi:MAG: hypothetical protein ABGX16_12985 [Pirellulales bacterium]
MKPMTNQPITRRSLLQRATATALGLSCAGIHDTFFQGEGVSAETAPIGTSATNFPPVRCVTRGPKHHWFGYYDKLQFDPSGRYLLGMAVDFEHRSPTSQDTIQIGMVDLHDHDRWIPLGESRAWCWQQGCMLQWLPGSQTEVLWNDRQGDRFVCHILNVNSHEQRTIEQPIYAVSPDGKSAVFADFRRIQDVRPGYGYPGLPDPFTDDLAPRDSGIFHIDLQTGRSQLILSLADCARMGTLPNRSKQGARSTLGVKHYFNHLLFSPDGERFIALHRWRYPDGSRLSRMITARPDGTEVRIVTGNGHVSHFIWRDPTHILAQSKELLGNPHWGDFLFEDKTAGIIEEIGHGVLDPSGHLSYLPGNQWILNDSYPQGRERIQTPHLYHVKSGRRVDLGHFHLPKVYSGEWRVDTHPRLSPDGRFVCIDAPHQRQGRQLLLIDIGAIVG